MRTPFLLLAGSLWWQSLCAQIAFDGSIGGSAGALTGPIYQIPAERGVMAGNNLLHSFSTFNLATGESANFNGPGTVTNILARVTGGPSAINGTIRSNIAGANLYLMNPAGIVFGQGAAVDVAGAFHATTADYIRLSDGRLFAATGAGNFSLLSAPPGAFGFLSSQSGVGEIRVSGPRVSPVTTGLDGKGRTLSLVGRSVEVRDAYLRSAGGTVAIAAAGEGACEIPVIPPDGAADPAMTGTATLRRAAVSVSGADEGRISIRGGRIVVDGAGRISSQITPGVEADARNGSAGDIEIAASDSVVISDGGRIGSQTRDARPGGTLKIVAGGELAVLNGGSIQMNSLGSGTAGSAKIETGAIHIAGGAATQVTGILTQTGSTGRAGTIDADIRGRTFIEDRGWIGALNFGSNPLPGSIRLSAESLEIIGLPADNNLPNAFLTGIVGLVTPGASGRGSDLSINVSGGIRLTRGGLIDASVLSVPDATVGGTGGHVTVTTGSLFVDRMGSDFFTGIGSDTEFASASPSLAGTTNAGDVSVTAGRIELWNGGLISSSSAGSGNAGSVVVRAESLVACGSGTDTEYVFSPYSGVSAGTSWETGAPQPLGQGGSVTVNAGSVSLCDGSQIATATVGPGKAGDISLSTGTLALGSGSAVSVKADVADAGSLAIRSGSINLTNSSFAASAGGDGGDIHVMADGLFFADRSRIEAEAVGNGGNIVIPGGGQLVLDHSAVSANAIVGNGGNILIRTDVFLANVSQVTASSQFGVDGVVRVDPLVALTGGEGEVNPPPLEVNDVLQPECSQRLPQDTGSFIVTGKGGTPRRPGGYMPSLRLLVPFETRGGR